MTQPLTELALAAAFIVAVGAGTLAVLPEPKPPTTTLAVASPPGAVRRAAPDEAKTDAERVEALQRALIEIAAEQKRLTATLRSLARERRAR